MLFNVHGKLDNFSNYINTTNLQTATYPNVTNKQKNYFDLGLSQALEATNYKINGGSVFYDREGNVVYNNPKIIPLEVKADIRMLSLSINLQIPSVMCIMGQIIHGITLL